MKRWLVSVLIPMLYTQPAAVRCEPYANKTLTSSNGELSVTIYLPESINPSLNAYYTSSRFEGGSMIGSIQRITTDASTSPSNSGNPYRHAHHHQHVFYGTDLWRVPHDPHWTESGVGLASEFGVGDDGALCTYRCGWYGVNNVNNGVLAYTDAKHGEPFLKIGVGQLIKGSCEACDSSEDYKFNSPYQFASPPVWTYEDINPTSIALQHEEVIHRKKTYGYRLRKTISLDDNVLSITSTLTNLGEESFTTPWYSHHFFSCDGRPVGLGYEVELRLKSMKPQIFDEPGTWSWSTPLRSYANVKPIKENKAIDVEMFKTIDDNVKIKAEFPKDDGTDGSFTLRSCGTSIKEEIPEIAAKIPDISMYAFNLYIEKGTLSPEPLILIHLEPGRSSSWTQRLEFNDYVTKDNENIMASSLLPVSGNSSILLLFKSTINCTGLVILLIAFVAAISVIMTTTVNENRSSSGNKSRRCHTPPRRSDYTPIPENDDDHL